MEKNQLPKLQATLVAYRELFRSATPLERSVLLMAMRVVCEEMQRLAPKKSPAYFDQVLAATPKQAA